MTIVDGVRMMDFDATVEARCLVAYHSSLDKAIRMCERFKGVYGQRSLPEEQRRTAETLRALRRLR